MHQCAIIVVKEHAPEIVQILVTTVVKAHATNLVKVIVVWFVELAVYPLAVASANWDAMTCLIKALKIILTSM